MYHLRRSHLGVYRGKTLRAFAFLSTIAALIACCSCGGNSGSASPTTTTPFVAKPGPAVALKPNLPVVASASAQDLTNAVDLTTNAGANGAMLSYRWNALEPTAGNITLSDLSVQIKTYAAKGSRIYVGIAVINTLKREVPPDLATVPFDSSTMKTRFHALIDAMKSLLNDPHVAYVSIGNEVDVYLALGPAELTPYLNFYQDAVAYVRQVAPNVKIGVTSTFAGLTNASMTSLNALSDIVIVNYYEQKPLTDIPGILTAAGQKPVVFQEIGCHDSVTAGITEDAQAQCVSDIFQVWKQNVSQIPFAAYFTLFDLSQTDCDQLSSYFYGGVNLQFESVFCHLGLRRVDGTAKPSWQAFVNGAISLKQ